MSQELVPKPAAPVSTGSKGPGFQILRMSMPALLVGAGLVEVFFFHGVVLGTLLVLGSIAWIVGGKLRVKITNAEGGAATAIASPEEAARRQLKRQLMKLQAVDGCEAAAERADEQFNQANERIRAFDRLLRSKLEPTELTFSRYHTAADQVFLGIVDRLADVAELLQSIEAIHPSELTEKLRAENPPGADALRERLALSQTQRKKALALLDANESALTQLDRANASLTEMRTQQGMAAIELPEALKQLEELAARAKNYSTP